MLGRESRIMSKRHRAWVFPAATTVVMAFAPSPALANDDTPLHEALGLPDDLVLRGNIRSRTESIDGQFRPTAAPDDVLQSFRTAVFVEYDAGPVRIGGEVRDARGYLQRRYSSAGVSEVNALEPLQAYVGLDLAGVGGKGASGLLQVGRFTMEIGAGRLVARPEFPNSVNSFTGVMLDWHGPSKDRLVAFWTMPSTRLPNDAQGLRDDRVQLDRARSAVQFFGGSYTRAALVGSIGGEGYVYRLAERDSTDQPTRNRHLVTYGGRVFRTITAGAIDFEIEAAHQTGRARATVAATDIRDVDISASLVHAELGRKSIGGWGTRVSLHGDFVSGDDVDPATQTRFDALYGATRVDFGPTGLYGPVTRANLVSGGMRVDIAPTKRLDGFVFGRELWLDSATDSFGATTVRDRTGHSGHYAGTQIEGRIRYWLTPKRLRLESGSAWLFKGAFLREAPNARATGNTHYFYFDLTADF